MKIYVVFGKTGEYSDRMEWPVKAFKKKEKAERLVSEAEKHAKIIEVTRKDEYRVPEGINPLDPKMQMDYTGTSYYYIEVELE